MCVVLQRARYDIFSAGILSAELGQLSPEQACVDLRNVRQLDACSLGQLVRTYNRLRAARAGVAMRLVNVDDRVRQIMRIARLDGVFSIEP